jgi:UDP-glucuronate decarboxylase
VNTPDEVTGGSTSATPSEVSVKELARIVRSKTGGAVEFDKRELPADDPKRRGPTWRASELLQSKQRVPLEQGLEKSIDYFPALVGGSRPARKPGALKLR